jgi:hypothetical protein
MPVASKPDLKLLQSVTENGKVTGLPIHSFPLADVIQLEHEFYVPLAQAQSAHLMHLLL